MWFDKYGDSYNTEEDARLDMETMMTWEDYEEYVLKVCPTFFEELWLHRGNEDWLSDIYVEAEEEYFKDHYYYDDDIMTRGEEEV